MIVWQMALVAVVAVMGGDVSVALYRASNSIAASLLFTVGFAVALSAFLNWSGLR